MANQIPYLDVQNLTKRFGAQVLFDNISFSIAEGQKVGLVARNGTGKSTLMSVLMDKEGHESGDIIYRRDLKVGYLEQSPKFDPEESVRVSRRSCRSRRSWRGMGCSDASLHTPRCS